MALNIHGKGFTIGHVRYINILTWLRGQTYIFGVVFFVSKSLLGIEKQKKLEKFAILTGKPRSHVRILIYRTWPIPKPCQKWVAGVLLIVRRVPPGTIIAVLF